EIGAGIGTLTAALAARAQRVVAIDLDARCVTACATTLQGHANVEVLKANALTADPITLGLKGAYVATGNLPYNLTGAVIARVLEAPTAPQRAVFLVQREVATRLSASSGDWSLATVAVRSLATVERLRDVPPSGFQPSPAVHSSILRLTPRRDLL